MATPFPDEHWSHAYERIAIALKAFYNKYEAEAPFALYNFAGKHPVFRKHLERLFNSKTNPRERVLDPIHLFASFNQLKQSDNKRTEIINSVFEILRRKRNYNQIDFKGCPSPFALQILSSRPYATQVSVWQVFVDVLNKGIQGIEDSLFKEVKSWFGLDIVSLTTFFFWIRPLEFLPLDANTRELFADAGLRFRLPKSVAEYREWMPEKKSTIYIEIAKAAIASQRSSYYQSVRERMIAFYKDPKSGTSGGRGLRIVAIRPLKRLANKYCKILKRDRLYQLHNAYNFQAYDYIRYDPNGELRLYDGNLTIDLCAVVGKNGSGKSTLWELMLVMLNNLSRRYADRTKILAFEPRIHAELFYHSGTMKKITMRGNEVTLTSFTFQNGVFKPRSKRKFDSRDMQDFFFTIAVSFSHYSLNSDMHGVWLERLFYKNDGYQIPITLSPKRRQGNIDMNDERGLLKARLLNNILSITDPTDEFSLRKLTDSQRSATAISLAFRRHEYREPEITNPEAQLVALAEKKFGFKLSKLPAKLQKKVGKYLGAKLLKIAYYGTYHRYFQDEQIKEETAADYIDVLSRDFSHITYKLWQTINYVKHQLYHVYKPGVLIDIERLSKKIDVIRSRIGEPRMEVIHFIPPPLFDVDILLGDVPFDDLSSGEKQRIYAVSSIVYHLKNIDSVAVDDEHLSYETVNVVLDEVELYFHPDMQRGFIHYLLAYLKRIFFRKLLAIHFEFITHSPFILSDIPDDHILFLDEQGLPLGHIHGFRTFGGNIHDLLANGFFLHNESLMGELAKQKIQGAVDYMDRIIKTGYENVPDEYWTREKIARLISKVGEHVIGKTLKHLYLVAFRDVKEIEKEISILQEFLTVVKSD